MKGPSPGWWRSVDGPTVALVALLALGWAGTAFASLAPQFWLERSHLQHGFAVFAATQFVPFMYTAENERVLLIDGAPDAANAEGCAANQHIYVHHVPLGSLLMPNSRPALALCADALTVELRSTWRHASVTSRWRVRRGARGYALERL